MSSQKPDQIFIVNSGFTLLAIALVAVPVPGMAQIPSFPNPSSNIPQNNPSFPNTALPRPQVSFPPSETAYTLGAGDRLRLDIFAVPEYSGEYQVLVDGSLNLPIVGSVIVQGMTLQQAAAAISASYSRYVKRPLLTASLLSPRALKIGVSGEVNRPGSYNINIPTTEGRQFPTVTQAIQLAGGMTQAANIHRVEIRRRQGNVSGQVVNVNLWQLFQSGDLSQDITLRDGDQIFLPTVADINPVETRQLATASFAAKPTEPLQISVVGEVYRPGPYIVEPIQRSVNGTISPPSPPTVTRAIQIAGGITSLADVRQIQIHRTTRVGNEKLINIDMWKLLQAGDINQDVILQEGDTIVVPKSTNINPAEATELAMASFSPDKIKVSVVGEVGKPGAVDLQPNTTLNQALLTAGGFNSRARQTVDLIRLNPNGTVSKQTIAVDFSLGIDENTNPALRNNDIIVVTPSDTAGIVDVLSLIFSPIGNLLRLFGR